MSVGLVDIGRCGIGFDAIRPTVRAVDPCKPHARPNSAICAKGQLIAGLHRDACWNAGRRFSDGNRRIDDLIFLSE